MLTGFVPWPDDDVKRWRVAGHRPGKRVADILFDAAARSPDHVAVIDGSRRLMEVTESPVEHPGRDVTPGETAPLLFTAFSSQYWSLDPTQPMGNVPVVVFQYAASPYESWQALAWAGAFVLTMFVLLLGVGARLILLRNRIAHD